VLSTSNRGIVMALEAQLLRGSAYSGVRWVGACVLFVGWGGLHGGAVELGSGSADHELEASWHGYPELSLWVEVLSEGGSVRLYDVFACDVLEG
jgi:hypothetical protein